MTTSSTSASSSMLYLKHPVEDRKSWTNHLERRGRLEQGQTNPLSENSNFAAVGQNLRRQLKHHHSHHHHHHDDDDHADHHHHHHHYDEEDASDQRTVIAPGGPSDDEGVDGPSLAFPSNDLDSAAEEKALYKLEKHRKKREKRMHELWANPSGIESDTVHGIMIDAGSSGSRLHVFEWQPRRLQSVADIQAAVSGSKLSFPGTDSRWTDRLRPGLASFATKFLTTDTPDDSTPDANLVQALAEYFQPLMEFAQAVLHTKSGELGNYPIFLRATAGMRILQPHQRARVMQAVRTLLHDATYCPFRFTDEQARVLSGEEEAIYDWAGVNFLIGDLITQSQGAGAVVNPTLTHGALDLGGASSQISFYQPQEDVMANLFKLQIGQAKHWNVYAHSALFFGMEEVTNRFHARLASGHSEKERMVYGIDNPCLPGQSRVEVQSNVYVDSATNMESWTMPEGFLSGSNMTLEMSGSGYLIVFKNDHDTGDVDECMDLVEELLLINQNAWCEFSHLGDCSFAGTYQPALPTSDTPPFGEFVAFSNYYHVWSFLHLPERASIAQLENATRYACSLSREDLIEFNQGIISDDDLDSFCFRSVYAFQLLHKGYGFDKGAIIRATDVINGQKVGWALGAMLYEINTMPWTYDVQNDVSLNGSYQQGSQASDAVRHAVFAVGSVLLLALGFLWMLFRRERSLRHMYEYTPIKDVEIQAHATIPRSYPATY